MKGNVNPFEPWRPRHAELVPPPINSRQPWRPPLPPGARRAPEPPLVEPVPQPAQPQKVRRCGGCRRPPSTLNTPVSELRSDQRVVLALVFGLGVLGLIGLGFLGGIHLPRVFLALLALGVGFSVGISLARRRAWFVRLGWLAVGLTLAALAGWFVPTTEGVSLWSAYAQLRELRNLPPGDLSAYLREAPARKRLVESFPAFTEDVLAGERAWLRRTVDEVIERGDQLLEADPQRASLHLQAAASRLSKGEHFILVQSELQAARRRAFRAWLEAARQEVQELLVKDRRAAADKVAQLAEELQGEALAIDCAAEVEKFRTAFASGAEPQRQP
jgi:hypothetical protein